MRLLLVMVLVTGRHPEPVLPGDPPEHIHMLVSAEGYEPLASNRYHPEGRASGRFDVLLSPSRS